MAALTFEEQESLATGQKFLRQGKSLFKENREHFHKESKKPIRSLLGGVIVSIVQINSILCEQCHEKTCLWGF